MSSPPPSPPLPPSSLPPSSPPSSLPPSSPSPSLLPPPPPHYHQQDEENLPLSQHRASTEETFSRRWGSINPPFSTEITAPPEARATPIMRSFSDNQGVRTSPEPPIRRFLSSGAGTAWREVQDTEIEMVDAASEIEEVLHQEEQESETEEEQEAAVQDSPTELQTSNANAITCSIVLAFVIVAFSIGMLISYETIVYGGSTDSVMYLDTFFPREHYRQIGFETIFVCDFYDWKIQALNCTFHFAALISILVIEIALAVKGKCRYLILLCIGCVFHAVGGLLCAVADDYIIFWMGRGMKGVGIGLLFESIHIMLDMLNMVGTEYKKFVENYHKFGLLLGPVVATCVNMVTGLTDSATPWKPASGIPSLLSAATLLTVVYLIRKPEVVREWEYRGMTCTRRSRPLVFIEVVRTLATPIQDLNLYSHIIVMLFTPNDKVTSSAPFAICLCQFIGLVTNGWFLKVTRKRLIFSSLIMAVIQVVTFLTIFIRNNVTSPFSVGMGTFLLILQAFFMLGNSAVSSLAGWVEFPFEEEVKSVERWMPIITMGVQGGIALLSPFLMCELGMKVYATWAGISALLTCFLYSLLPETRDAASKEIQRERFRSHWFWQYLV